MGWDNGLHHLKSAKTPFGIIAFLPIPAFITAVLEA
jgi:hypothetical protein